MFDINVNHHFTALLGSEAIKYTFEDLAATRKDYAFEVRLVLSFFGVLSLFICNTSLIEKRLCYNSKRQIEMTFTIIRITIGKMKQFSIYLS